MHVPALTSTVTLVIVAVGATTLPVGVAVLAYRAFRGGVRRRMALAASALVLCLLAQALAVTAVFVRVNDSFGFYTSYGDMLGHTGRVHPIRVDAPRNADGGRFRLLSLHGGVSHTRATVVVWLPPQYDDPAYRDHRFPVVEFLPGQPSTPAGVLRHFDIVGVASAMIAARQVQPFVLVVPPLMIRPPTDTECTDVPHGPRAFSWLDQDVKRTVSASLRVQPPGRHWALLGWSTGAFCAAKLILRDPGLAHAAVGFGGYYQPITHRVYPHLFGGSAAVRRENSPQALYRAHGLRGDRLLLIGGRQDSESWRSTERMLRATRGDRHVSYVVFQHGGHNTADYAHYLRSALAWVAHTGTLG